MLLYQFLTLATVMLNLSKAGVTGSPSSRSRSPCRKNSSQARCDHKRDTLHGLHQIDYSKSKSSRLVKVQYLLYLNTVNCYPPAWIGYVRAFQRDLQHEAPKSRHTQVQPGVLVGRVQVLPQLAEVLCLARYVRRQDDIPHQYLNKDKMPIIECRTCEVLLVLH